MQSYPVGRGAGVGAFPPRLGRPALVLLAGLAVFALLGWEGVSTVGRLGAIDSAEYLVNAQYLDAHGTFAPAYVSYEYSAPPLYEVLAVGLERFVRHAPALQLELPWNTATRLVWLLAFFGSAGCLASRGRRVRLLGVAGIGVAALWGIDEAISLGKVQTWAAGQLLALGAGIGLIVVSALISRELWPGHPVRWLATAAFAAAYPVVLQLSVLFHPETTSALLAALATLVTITSSRRAWPLRLGVAAGLLCGLGLLTRQSAVVLVACVLIVPLLASGRRAGRFVAAAAAVTLLVSGPWLGYAAYTWGNPLQGNLQRPGDMIAGGEPLSFYASFPIVSLVAHPYRPYLANELLPQLHADLWSDWFGVFRANGWSSPSAVSRATASSMSALGLIGDALALGGLAAFGVPAFARVVRRRADAGADVAFAFLALLAVTAFAGLALQIVRYPQIGGVEIKTSYLLFTAPAWAVFSVAAWLTLARRHRLLRTGLAVAAGLYAISYATSLGATFMHPYEPVHDLVEPTGYVDLASSIQQLNPAPATGGEADFTVWVKNEGTLTASNVVLNIALERDMRLLGPPAHDLGSSCSGFRTIQCPLQYLDAGASTPVTFGVDVNNAGRQRISTSVSSYQLDSNPTANRASLTMLVRPDT